MNCTVAIQPVGIRAEELAAFYGSDSVAREIVERGLLQPIRKNGKLTIYDAGDCARAWVKWCEMERRQRKAA